MEWNNQLTALNYLLADIYDTMQASKRLLDHAQIPKINIEFSDQPMQNWHGILKFLRRDDERLFGFLDFLISTPDEATYNNEHVKGIRLNLKEQVVSKQGPVMNDNWKGEELSPSTREKIIGKRSNILPISFLEIGMDCSKAVARILVGDEAGTGFLIGNNWFITNNHVISSIETARAAKIQFNYQLSKEGRILLHEDCLLDPGTVPGDQQFFTNKAEDWTIVKTAGSLNARYGALKLSDKGVRKEQFVNIIQHPDGGPKQIALYNNMVMYSDDNIVQYLTDTLPGSSGAPVLNTDWEVVALHTSGGWTREPGASTRVFRNTGTNINKLLKAVQDNRIDINVN